MLVVFVISLLTSIVEKQTVIQQPEVRRPDINTLVWRHVSRTVYTLNILPRLILRDPSFNIQRQVRLSIQSPWAYRGDILIPDNCKTILWGQDDALTCEFVRNAQTMTREELYLIHIDDLSSMLQHRKYWKDAPRGFRKGLRLAIDDQLALIQDVTGLPVYGKVYINGKVRSLVKSIGRLGIDGVLYYLALDSRKIRPEEIPEAHGLKPMSMDLEAEIQ